MGDFLLRTLAHVWTALEPLSQPMALMGGLALAAWKHVRATRDVDLLLGLSPNEIPALLAALGRAGVRPQSEAATRLGRLELLQCRYEPPESFLELQVDLLLGQSDFDREALRRRVRAELPGLEIPIFVLSPEDLLLYKLLAGRMIDRYDAEVLLRVNRARMDLDYLGDWADRLNLGAEWSDLRRDV